MSSEKSVRRAFLKTAGAGLACSGLLALPTSSLAEPAKAGAKQRIFDVTEFGARGDGKALDTPAINRAIEAAATAGGGTVHFPAGAYLCFSIHLKSNVTVDLSRGSTIIAADSPTDGKSPGYDLAESNAPWEAYQDYGHNHWHNSLIWGVGLENIAITGPGLIWGRGLSRGTGLPKAESPGVGNKSIALKNCHNVLLRDFSILHGGHFGILATGVDNFTIDNLKIDTNRDGMDIDCCRNVRITQCSVNSPWDDGICLKSSYALGYARATELVTISDCVVSGSYQEGTLLDGTFKPIPPEEKHIPRNGRIKCGTESNGGFKNITIANCICEGCRGLALESVDGALLEDVTITNITMRGAVDGPMFIRLGARMRGPAGIPVGTLRRVIISNVACSGARSSICSIITGIPGHPIEGLKLSNIFIQHMGGGTKEDAALVPPENENGYPEPNRFGHTPANGFYIRHVNDIDMSNVSISEISADARPDYVLDDVHGASFFDIKTPRVPGVPTMVLENVTDFDISRSNAVADTKLDTVVKKVL